MNGPYVFEEQDGVRDVDTPCRRTRTRPHRPRDMETKNQNEVKPPTFEQCQSIVAVRDRLDSERSSCS